MEEQDPSKMTDHDLMVSMHGTLKRAVEDIKSLDNKVTDFNNNYAKKAEVEIWRKDHEDRLRTAEKNITRVLTYGSAFMIALMILELALKYYK